MQFLTHRRLFLQGACGAALATLASGATSRREQSVRGTFNGGRSQVGLTVLQVGGAYPFLNCLKTAESWKHLDDNTPPDPNTLDGDGYPVSISSGGIYTVFFVPRQAARRGNYIVTWNGNGTIIVGMPHTAIVGSKISTNGSGRYEFGTSEDRFVIGISSIGNPRITDLKVFHVDDEAALNSGEIFGTKFKQRLVEANFGVIRFAEWQYCNSTNVTTWATRKPITYVVYSGSEFRASLYAGLTTNVGAAYHAMLPNFILADKATVIVKFNASGDGPCTLNVSGTGDINILDENADALSSGKSSPVGGTRHSIATLVYDATLNAWIKQGGDLAVGSKGIENGCPPELMVRLCAEVGAHPYFVTPPFSIDPATNYIPSLASLCRANGPPWMIPRFEGPNECWNTAPGAYSTGYAKAKATAYGWGADFHNWYGKIMSVLGQAVSTAYGNDRKKYQVLCGVQTVMANHPGAMSSCNARLASTKYLSQSSPPQSTYAKSAASNWVTHICCAQYFQPSDFGTQRETAAAADYAAAADNPALRQSIATAYANTANSGSGAFTLSECAVLYAGWKTWAQSFGIKKMCAYEGGYSPDYTGSQADQLRAASKLAPSLGDFTIMNYKNFVNLSDADFTAEFPSCFRLSGMNTRNNAWSILDDVYQTPNQPQWNAIVAFNHWPTP